MVFYSNREGVFNLWWQATNGSEAAERLTTSDNIQEPTSISADGKEVIFFEVMPTPGRDLMRLSLDGERRVAPLLRTRFDELNGELSPDGRWLAYESNNSGQYEICVRPSPQTDAGQWPISTAGGIQPVWAGGGKELLYLAPDGSVMSVAVETDRGTWRAAAPAKLFQGRYYTQGPVPPRMYDVTRDGQRLLMLKPSESPDQLAAPLSMVIVQHFGEELKARVPTK